MKRRLLIVAVFLLAGAVVNVAVAWGCCLAARPLQRSRFQHSDASTTVWWYENKPDGVMDEPSFFETIRCFGWTHVTFVGGEGGVFNLSPSGDWSLFGDSGDNLVLHTALHLTAGFPLRSFQGQSWYTEAAINESGIIRTRQHWLPYGPIWPGFAVNSLVYAIALWLLALGLFALRSFIRTRRGLCPACAYPRGESDICSECGKALSSSVTVTT